MASVYTVGEEKCPVCGSTNTTFDLESSTNEQELFCREPGCGFVASTRIFERGVRRYWEVSQQFPMDEKGYVRRPAGSVLDFSAQHTKEKTA
ncbi:MAG: hypothetical protein WA197_26535 [Candidatus Acidiferrales bacterium]